MHSVAADLKRLCERDPTDSKKDLAHTRNNAALSPPVGSTRTRATSNTWRADSQPYSNNEVASRLGPQSYRPDRDNPVGPKTAARHPNTTGASYVSPNSRHNHDEDAAHRRPPSKMGLHSITDPPPSNGSASSIRDNGHGSRKRTSTMDVLLEETCPFELNSQRCPYSRCSKKSICVVS